MSNRNCKVSATNSAHAVERCAGVENAPILLSGRELEAVAAAGSKFGGTTDGRR